MKIADYKKLLAKSQSGPKKNKYGARKVKTDEGTFDSEGEHKYWCKLKMMQKAGIIEKLERQVRFDFVINGVKIGHYTCDFFFFDVEQNKARVLDFKGKYRLPPDVPLRMKLVKALHGHDVEIVHA